jgi:acetyl-CoA carboxylase carboxyl transferase alpha subunit
MLARRNDSDFPQCEICNSCRYADKFGLPIITFVDTPGAFAGRSAEELGQGEAIARNLREMFGLRVPIISVVIGEGGSGGALAIGCANHNLIMENAVYYVASPEACAAILWKSREESPIATEALRITASDLVGFGVMDTIIDEPLGGAHRNPMGSFPFVKEAILNTFRCVLVPWAASYSAFFYQSFGSSGQLFIWLLMSDRVPCQRVVRTRCLL